MKQEHISDEQLLFYYYNDGMSLRERQDITSAIATDATVAERYQRLASELGDVPKSVLAPPTDMVERWHDSIKAAARRGEAQKEQPALHNWSFFWGVAVTAALAVGIVLGMLISGDDTGGPTIDVPQVATTAQTSAFVRGLQVHLRESQEGLSTYATHSVTDQSELLLRIIDQNRLFERAARNNDADNIARVLRAFELVLMRMAAEETAPEDVERMRSKLMFELNIMLTKIARDTSEEPQTI